MRVAPAAMVVAMVALGAGPAVAQTAGPRVLLSVNLGLQPGSEALADAGTFTLYDEAGLLGRLGRSLDGCAVRPRRGLPCRRARHGRPVLPALVQCRTPGRSAARRPTPCSSTSRGRSRPRSRRRALGERVPFQHRLSAAGHRPARSAPLRRADAVRAVPAGGDGGDRDRGSPPSPPSPSRPPSRRAKRTRGVRTSASTPPIPSRRTARRLRRRRLPPLRRGQHRHSVVSRTVETDSRRLPVRRRPPLPLLVSAASANHGIGPASMAGSSACTAHCRG